MARPPNYAYERNSRANKKAAKREAKRQAKLIKRNEDAVEAQGAALLKEAEELMAKEAAAAAAAGSAKKAVSDDAKAADKSPVPEAKGEAKIKGTEAEEREPKAKASPAAG
jgi:hypothetical protein